MNIEQIIEMGWGTILSILLIGILIFIGWVEMMYYLAGKEKKILFGIVFGIGIIFTAGQAMYLMLSDMFASILIGLVTFLFVLFLGATIYEQAGMKQRSWVYLTLIFPVLTIVYHLTKHNR